MVVQQDDELFPWVLGAVNPSSGAGSFVKAFADACLCADEHNYELLRPVLRQIASKYPTYFELGVEQQ